LFTTSALSDSDNIFGRLCVAILVIGALAVPVLLLLGVILIFLFLFGHASVCFVRPSYRHLCKSSLVLCLFPQENKRSKLGISLASLTTLPLV